MPAGIAFVHLAGPLSTRTTWSVEAATARGGVSRGSSAARTRPSSPIGTASRCTAPTAGSARRRRAASASTASRTTPAAPAASQVVDHWTIGPRAMLDVGGRYERYDYLRDPGLFSPAITASLSPAARTWVRVTAAREMSAPGAEEFVPQAYGSLRCRRSARSRRWSPARRSGQETRHVGISLEQDSRRSWSAHALPPERRRPARHGVRSEPGRGQRRADLSHYGVASVGDFAASGWGVGVSRPVGTHLRGGLDTAARTSTGRPAIR